MNYMGQASTTVSGQACLRWDKPEFHSYVNGLSFPDESISAAGNFCRNPDSDPGGVWCFQSLDVGDYGYCDVTQCAGQYFLRI